MCKNNLGGVLTIILIILFGGLFMYSGYKQLAPEYIQNLKTQVRMVERHVKNYRDDIKKDQQSSSN
jgi:hypothetical protein